MNVHGDALCFMVETWARHKTTETVLKNGWRLAAVGGLRLAFGGGWQLVIVGSGPQGLSLNEKEKLGFLKTALAEGEAERPGADP